MQTNWDTEYLSDRERGVVREVSKEVESVAHHSQPPNKKQVKYSGLIKNLGLGFFYFRF